MQPSIGDGSRLARIDSWGSGISVAELRRRALAKLPRSGGRPVLDPGYQGMDSSRAVAVTVDTRLMVTDVDVSRNWTEWLPVGGFARALMEAYHTAAGRCLEAMSLVRLWEDEQRRVAGGERPDEAVVPEPETPPEDPQGWLYWIQDSLYELDEQIHRIERMERDRAGGRETAVWGPHAYLRVTHRGKEIVTIEGDSARIRRAGADQLRSEALQVLKYIQSDSRQRSAT